MSGEHFAFEDYTPYLNSSAFPTLGRSYGPPPGFDILTAQAHRRFRYALNWSLYEGNAYQSGSEWVAYKDAHNLAWRTRQIRNMVAKLCQFYGSHLYPGSLIQPGQPAQIGIEQNLGIDVPEGNQGMFTALSTLWEWWGWPDGLRTGVIQNAALGDLLFELVDDIPRRKIMCQSIWPGYVRDVETDAAGNLKKYTKEYGVVDPVTNEPYVYARTITTKDIRTFKNNEPWDYVTNRPNGPGAVQLNPYTFVPARWFRWNETGSEYGEPAIYTAQSIYDDLCVLAAAATDRMVVHAESPLLVAGTAAPGSVRSAIDDFYEFEEQRPVEAQPASLAKLKVLQVPEGTSYQEPRFDMGNTENRITAIEDGLFSQFPEIRFEDMLREMTQLTGPGAERAMLDVRTRYSARASTVDRHVIALTGMGTAMAGMRMNDGSWDLSADVAGEALTEQHQAFKAYDLASYGKGDLKFTFLERTLVPSTIEERLETGQMKLDMGVPALEVFTRDLGYSEQQLREWEDKGLVAKGFFTGGASTPTPEEAIEIGDVIRERPETFDQIVGPTFPV